MRKYKRLFQFIVILLAFFTITQLLKSYNESFSIYDCFKFSEIDADMSDRLNRIQNIFDENSLEYFAVYSYTDSSGVEIIDIYCPNEETKEYLEENENRKSGKYFSMFTGVLLVNYFTDFDVSCDKVTEDRQLNFYILNENVNYASIPVSGEYLKENVTKGEKFLTSLELSFFVWGILFFILLLLSAADSYIYKKELFVQLAFGHNWKILAFKRLVTETAWLCFSFFLCIVITQGYAVFRYIDCLLLVFPLADSAILLLPFVRIEFKKNLASNQKSLRILTGCYIARIIVIVTEVLVITLTAKSLMSFIQMRLSSNVIDNYKGYSYDYKNPGKIYEENELYLRPFDYAHCIDGSSFDCIIANRAAQGILIDYMYELSNLNLNEPIICIPAAADGKILDDEMNSYKKFIEEISHKENIQICVYSATEKFSVLSVRTECDDPSYNIFLGSDLVINLFDTPMILYVPEILDYADWSSGSFVKDGLPNCVSIYDEYQNALRQTKSQCIMWMCAGIAFLILSFAVTKTALKLEYSINGTEICLKRIYGMPFLQRYRGVLEMLALSYTCSFILNNVITDNLSLFSKSVMVLIVLAAIGFDFFEAVFQMLHWENENTVKILKGGCL